MGAPDSGVGVREVLGDVMCKRRSEDEQELAVQREESVSGSETAFANA